MLSVHRQLRDAGSVLGRRARIASDEHRRNAIPKNRDRGMARYPPLIGAGFLYGGLAAAYHRHRRRPESRADQKHRTEFAPLLVQQFGRDRNSRSSRLGNPEDTAARPGALVNPHGELLSFL
jgi:hypothetical protein